MNKSITLILVTIFMFLAGMCGALAGRMVANIMQAREPEVVIVEVVRFGTIPEMQEFAGVTVDGVWGPKTDRAYRDALSEFMFTIEMENIKQADRANQLGLKTTSPDELQVGMRVTTLKGIMRGDVEDRSFQGQVLHIDEIYKPFIKIRRGKDLFRLRISDYVFAELPDDYTDIEESR